MRSKIAFIMDPFLPFELVQYYNEIQQFDLKFEVISCIQAARAKNIPIKNELKTLLLSTCDGFFVAHILGDRSLDNRLVKKTINCKNAALASPKDLNSIGLSSGTVCAIREPIWSMHHLISEEVLEQIFVSTNDGTRTGYYRFDQALTS